MQDSGKPMVDAAFGELMVTCEKATWIARRGEAALKPEHREPGVMVWSPMHAYCKLHFPDTACILGRCKAEQHCPIVTFQSAWDVVTVPSAGKFVNID